MIDLRGKRALVFGVASEDSIAWGICQKLAEAGAVLTLGYQMRFKSRLMQLVNQLDAIEAYHLCDVANEESVAQFFSEAQGQYDILIHAVAFAPRTAFESTFENVTEEDFVTATVISSYSLMRLTRHAVPRFNPDASIICLTYLGATQVVVNYKLMGTAKAALESITRELAASLGPKGIRVNAISSGPIRTLAASGVPGFDNMLSWVEKNAPLRRNVTKEDIGNLAAFLASSASRALTGQVIFADNGYSTIGVPEGLETIRYD